MIKEFELFGVYLPPMFVYVAMAWVVWRVIRMVLLRIGFYRWVWHAPLFGIASFLIVLAAIVVVFI